MPAYLIGPILSKPGVRRDSTPYAASYYNAAQWCRFYDGAPRKMGGYRLIDKGTVSIIRDMFSISQSAPYRATPSIDLYLGRSGSISYINVDYNGNNPGNVGEIDRSPSGLSSDPNNVWDFAQFPQETVPGVSGEYTNYIVAQVAPNGVSISNSQDGFIYAGPVNSNAPLEIVLTGGMTPFPVSVSGGIIFDAPRLIAYGSNGQIFWSNDGDITTWLDINQAIVANTKIVQAVSSRGGILMWSLDQLIRIAYVPTNGPIPATYSAAPIENITIMSADSVVNYNQEIFWVGTNQFYRYNGIVQQLKNNMNQDWFFQNINLKYRSKVWGTVNEKYSEIIWHYPRILDYTRPDYVEFYSECNATIIYNVQLDIWYDSFISRSCGVPVSVMPYPIWADSAISLTNNTYGLWMHEYFWDIFIPQDHGANDIRFAIKSNFTTNYLDLWTGDPKNSRLLRNRRIATDFEQAGEMSVSINGQMYPNDDAVVDGPHSFFGKPYALPPFLVAPAVPATPFIDFASQGGIISFTFESYAVGGFYQCGKPLYVYDIGDTLK